MSHLVPASDIERIVGRERHATVHYAQAVSAEHTVYILHSRECLDTGRDLRECEYSKALDRGIAEVVPWTGWRRVQDRPVSVEIFAGYLVPEFQYYKNAIKEKFLDTISTRFSEGDDA